MEHVSFGLLKIAAAARGTWHAMKTCFQPPICFEGGMFETNGPRCRAQGQSRRYNQRKRSYLRTDLAEAISPTRQFANPFDDDALLRQGLTSEQRALEEVPLVKREPREEELPLSTPFRAWSGVAEEDSDRPALF